MFLIIRTRERLPAMLTSRTECRHTTPAPHASHCCPPVFKLENKLPSALVMAELWSHGK